MIRPLGVGIARISGLLTKTSSGAYAAETAKIAGNGTRSSLFYIVQKSPLTLSPGVPTPGVDGSIARPALQRRVRRRLSPPAKSQRTFSSSNAIRRRPWEIIIPIPGAIARAMKRRPRCGPRPNGRCPPALVRPEGGPRGAAPRAKTSTMIMRPPQHGHGGRWEAALEGKLTHGLTSGVPATSLVESQALLKGVLREGSLQEKPGPSVATEFGVLLPGINDQHGTGAVLNGIVSQRWDWGTVHLNVQIELTRQQHADYFLDSIIEGPHDWPVRPVAGLRSSYGLLAASG